MNVGDKFPVTIQGHEVGTALVVQVNSDNTVELRFDGGRATFATKTYIEQAPVEQVEHNEHQILGVETPNNDTVVVQNEPESPVVSEGSIDNTPKPEAGTTSETETLATPVDNPNAVTPPVETPSVESSEPPKESNDS